MKKFYKENRIFVILMGIALVCIAVIVAMMTWYIINSNTMDMYGNRLDGIEDVKINEKMITDMETTLSENELVQEVTINVHGKIVNFNIDFSNDASIDDAKNIGIKCLEFFEENYLNFYDIQFLFSKSASIESEEVFPILGYSKRGATTITWSNNAK